jgi:hypothetical protein
MGSFSNMASNTLLQLSLLLFYGLSSPKGEVNSKERIDQPEDYVNVISVGEGKQNSI